MTTKEIYGTRIDWNGGAHARVVRRLGRATRAASLILTALSAFNANASEPQIEVVPFPVGEYDYQDRVVACNLAMNTSLAVDGAERFLANADYLDQRCGLRGVLAAAEQEACAAWKTQGATANCIEWLNEFRGIRGDANKIKRARPNPSHLGTTLESEKLK